MIKLIVCDLDGTLLTSNQELSDYNAKMLRLAQKNGIEFMIATGRNMKLIRPFMQKYDLRCGCILMNGAEVRDKEEKVLNTINVSKKVVTNLHEDLLSREYMPFYTTNEGVFYIGSKREFETGIGYRQKCLERTCENITLEEAINIGMATPYAKEAIGLESLKELLENCKIEIRKIVVFHTDVNKNTETIKYLENKYDNLAIAGSYPEDIEINDIYAQKGYGLARAIDKMGIKKEEVAVFGDGLNDASLFKEFPNSYAMSNAVDSIKRMSSEVILSNDEDGVGKKIAEIIACQ